MLFTYLRDAGVEIVMDEDGNRAAVTLDQAGYTIGHATKIENCPQSRQIFSAGMQSSVALKIMYLPAWSAKAVTGSLSGLHEYYDPEDLVGKTCIAITNLLPRPMMGIQTSI